MNNATKSTILVAEDNPFFRRLLTHQLTSAGYEVLVAEDGRQAMDCLHEGQFKPDLVLVDLMMPHYSGLDVIAKIKTFSPKVPVILMSGAEATLTSPGVTHSNPDLFLSKPFSSVHLLASIRSMLAGTRSPKRFNALICLN